MRIVKRLLWSIPAVSKLAGPLEDFVVATVAAAGSTKADPGVITTAHITTVTAADDSKGVILPAGVALGETLIVVNTVANKTLKVYPPAGKKINGATADVALVMLAGTAGYFTSVGGDDWVGA
jgi:hypothetical protein